MPGAWVVSSDSAWYAESLVMLWDGWVPPCLLKSMSTGFFVQDLVISSNGVFPRVSSTYSISFLWKLTTYLPNPYMFNKLSTMQLYRSLLLTALASTCVRAQTLTEPEIHSAVAAPNAAALSTPTIPGDPTQPSSYPLCAQKCGNQSVALVPLVDYGCDLAEVACQCQPQFRATTAACKTILMKASNLASLSWS